MRRHALGCAPLAVAILCVTVKGDMVELDEFAARMVDEYERVLHEGDQAADSLFCELATIASLDDHDGAPQLNHSALNRGHPMCSECKKWVDYYDYNKNGALCINEFMPFVRELKQWHAAFKLGKFEGPDPPGHLQRLGSSLPSATEIDIITADKYHSMKPKEFWEKYVHAHRPVLWRGVEVNSTAYREWNEEHLDRKFGWIELKMEPKVESRGNRTAYIHTTEHHHRANLSYLMKAQGAGMNIYAVTALPQPMAWEVNIPKQVRDQYTQLRTPPHPPTPPSACFSLLHFLFHFSVPDFVWLKTIRIQYCARA
jgi:hypothetical protein